MSKKFIIDVDSAVLKYNAENPEKPLNREKLAKKTGLTYQSIMNYQLGKIPVMISTLKKISKITGVSIDDLIKEKND